MNNSKILFTAVLATSIMLYGCSDTELVLPVNIEEVTNVNGPRESATSRKALSPTAFIINGRMYSLSYDADGNIAQIIATQSGSEIYRYVAYYEGSQLIRAELVEDGKVMSANTNFQVDDDGNIVAYDYASFFYPEFPDGLVQHYTLSYTDDGQLDALPDGTPLVYDSKGNVIQAGSNTYSYDRGRINPLGSYSDLWLVLVEESGYALLTLSPNVTKTITTASGQVQTFANEFSGRRLIRQSLGSTEIISFEY